MIGVPVALLLAPTGLPADRIAPPLDRPMRVTLTEVRDDGRTARRFTLVRDITFAAEIDGFVATIVLNDATATGPARERAMFGKAYAGLIGRRMIVHLDGAGAVRSLDDEAANWTAWLDGIAALGPKPSAAPVAAGLRDRLATLPVERRRALLTSIVANLVAAPQDRAAGPARPVQFAGGVYNSATALVGTAQTLVDGDAIRSEIHATASTTGSGEPAVELSSTKLVDPATGLVRSSIQRTITHTPNAGTLTREIRLRIE